MSKLGVILRSRYNKLVLWGICSLVWFVGFSVIFLIAYFSKSQPDFIQENDIITWHDVQSYFIIFCCFKITSEILSFKRGEASIKDRVEICEERLTIVQDSLSEAFKSIGEGFGDLEKRQGKFEKSTESLEGELYNSLNKIKTQVNVVEGKLKNLSSELLEHTWDCKEKHECQYCRAVLDEIHTEDGVGMCSECQMPNYFDRVKQSFHVSQSQNSIRKSKKAKLRR